MPSGTQFSSTLHLPPLSLLSYHDHSITVILISKLSPPNLKECSSSEAQVEKTNSDQIFWRLQFHRRLQKAWASQVGLCPLFRGQSAKLSVCLFMAGRLMSGLISIKGNTYLSHVWGWGGSYDFWGNVCDCVFYPDCSVRPVRRV